MATISFSSDLDRAAYVLANDAIKPSKAAPKFRAAVEAAGLSVSEVVAHGNKVKAAIKQEAGGGAAPRSKVDIRLPEVPFAATPDAPARQSSLVPAQEAPAVESSFAQAFRAAKKT